jgi:DNA-directed RNA polymerase specialized sigma24 family protein
MDKLNEIVSSKVYRSITKKVCHNHRLHDDLHAEAILLIIEKQYDLEANTNLPKFFATIAWLTWRSNKFRKKYFTHTYSLESMKEWDDEGNELELNQLKIEKTIEVDNIKKMLNDSYKDDFEYYEKNLLKMYVKLGDCKAVSKQTNIPYRTVANDIKTIKDNLKKAHNEENTD